MLEVNKPKVLVVDDIEVNLQLIVNILLLGDEDYEVLTANSASDGCKLAEEELPDLILMDWEMPNMSGIDAIKHLKKGKETKDIPILMVTAYTSPELVKEAFDVGASDFIKKPIDGIDLRSRIKSSLRMYSYLKTIREQNKKIDRQNKELRKLALVAEKTSNSFIILDLDGNIVWVNKGFEYLHELNNEKIKSFVGTNIFENPLYKDYKEIFQKCIDEKSDTSFTILINEEVANQKWFQVSLSPVLNSNNTTENVVAIETDITSLKQKEEEIKTKHKKLKLLTRFLGKANSKLEVQSEEISSQKLEIENEKQRTDSLLFNILPYETAMQLKNKGVATPLNYKLVSVLFTDFKSFSKNSMKMQPNDLVNTLDSYFRKFDEIIEKNHLEKIKTIGDAYMCAGGLPLKNKSNPIDAVLAGLQIQEFISSYNDELELNEEHPWELRIGIHTGSVIAGVIGVKKFAYDIWGKTVNIASRMESGGEVGRVNISGATYEHIKDYFDCTYRGKIEAKNIGKIDMYFVNGLKSEYSTNERFLSPNSDFQKILNAF